MTSEGTMTQDSKSLPRGTWSYSQLWSILSPNFPQSFILLDLIIQQNICKGQPFQLAGEMNKQHSVKAFHVKTVLNAIVQIRGPQPLGHGLVLVHGPGVGDPYSRTIVTHRHYRTNVLGKAFKTRENEIRNSEKMYVQRIRCKRQLLDVHKVKICFTIKLFTQNP